MCYCAAIALMLGKYFKNIFISGSFLLQGGFFLATFSFHCLLLTSMK